ncbi:two-component system response regulator YesN [Paenibacillus rhizosphaerae]|uniref:Two-component system response regulator YesN n=1 Tax=Paenibacillus rhizosphaerae TaxID=297318 RepID=A0A839TTG4_9BACL|nr:response regulator [Paenibacillus rhizosphaerae]MBB3128579.1 two-component system response regulator YesN [Paenibacillus rhizosphaerae]
MIRVLIVDDEILVRIGLKTIIPWEDNGFELIGEAANGEEALRLLRDNPCDIVLTDIRMPGCDGLQLMEEIRKLSPQTRCLILSNHNDFEYVQKALRLGAADYILKLTMEPSELLQKLNSMKETILQEEEKSLEASRLEVKVSRYGKEAKEKRLRELLIKRQGARAEVKEIMQEFGLRAYAPPIYVINLRLDEYLKVLKQNNFRSEHLLHYTVANVIGEVFKKYSDGELLDMGGGLFAILTDRYQEAMVRDIQDAVNTFLKLSVSVGISGPFEDILDLHHAYDQAEKALEFRFYAGPEALVYFDRIEYAKPNEIAAPWLQAQWEKLLDIRDGTALLAYLDHWYRTVLAGPILPPDVERENWVHWIHLMDGFARRLGGDLYSAPLHEEMYPYHAVRSLETLEEIYMWCSGWLPVYLEYVKSLSHQQVRPEIQVVLEIINKQFNQPLKVSELAKSVGFTENYLSILFKKETGQTIMDHLTRIRMDRARELLKDQTYKIYEISEMVGYGDSNYFSKQFKRMEGVYPLEFRRLYFGK